MIAPYPPENKDGFAILFSFHEMRLRISAKKNGYGFLGSGDNGAIIRFLDSARLRSYYYTCEPFVRSGNLKDIEKQASFQKYVSKLKRLSRFEVKLGRLQLINGSFKQKMVDVLMSLDIANMSYENQVQHVVIIAGDSDFIPAIRNAKSYGAIIHLFYHSSSVHNDLLDHVDERYEITPEFVDKIKVTF